MGLTKDTHIEKSRVISVLTDNGKFRISAIQNTNVANDAKNRHNLPLIPALLLARALSASSLLAVSLKGEERIIIEAVGDGPVNKVSAEAIQVGEVRGFVEYNSSVNYIKLDNFDIALGPGVLRVLRILYNEPEPIIGIVELIRGDIASDLSYYFTKSEQIFTIVILDAEINHNTSFSNSCGLILQALPGATDKDQEQVLKHFNKLPRLVELITPKMGLKEALAEILPWNFTVLKHDRVDFFCRCSKETFIQKLLTLELKDIREMKMYDQRELVCRFCNAHYYLDDNDFNRIEETIIAKTN
ncbi:MAG: Hsp33 family molecular chaperone HslO [Candidatus Kapaibacteriales bacterium]